MERSSEIQCISDTEIRIEGNLLLIIDENTIHVVAHGQQTGEIALAHLRHFQQFADSVKDKINFLIDLNDAGKSSPQARKVWKDLGEHERVNKVALFGIHPVARVLASFVTTISNGKTMRFFSTREEALNWLRK